MKKFLNNNETVSIPVIINSLENSLENKNTFAILSTCFTIPDILSKIDKNCKGDDREKYYQWFNNHISEKFITMENTENGDIIALKADLFYQLRNSFLHAGNIIICHKVEIPFDNIEFVYDDEGLIYPNNIGIITSDNSYKVLNTGNEIKLIYIEDKKTIVKKLKIYVNCLAEIFIDALKQY